MSCLICKEEFGDEPTVQLTDKGLQTVIRCSLIRQDNLDKEIREAANVIVHCVCRQKYTRFNSKGKLQVNYTSKINNDYDAYTKFLLSKDNNYYTKNLNPPESSVPIEIHNSIRKIKPQESTQNLKKPSKVSVCFTQDSPTSLAQIKYNQITNQDNSSSQIEHHVPVETSSEPDRFEKLLSTNNEIDPSQPFPFEHLCFICAKDISSTYIRKQNKWPVKRRNVVKRVKGDQFKNTVIKCIENSIIPETKMIIQRIKDVDLVQVNAGFHKKCRDQLPLMGTWKGKGQKKLGRPEDPEIVAAMENIYKYIDGTNRTNYTIKELADLQGIPGSRTVKAKLENRYPGRVYFTSVTGRCSTVVTIVKDTNEFDPNQDDADYIEWRNSYVDSNKKAEKEKREEMKKLMEETLAEEKRKSLRLTDTENKQKETLEAMKADMEENKKKDDVKDVIEIENKKRGNMEAMKADMEENKKKEDVKDVIEIENKQNDTMEAIKTATEEYKKKEDVEDVKRRSNRITEIQKRNKETITANTKVKIDKKRRRKKKKNKSIKQKLEKEIETYIEEDDNMSFEGDIPSPERDDMNCEVNDSFDEEDYKNVLICRICLSSDRSLDVLGVYCDMYRKICGDIVPDDDTKLFLICWECRAVLVHAERFRARAVAAHNILMSKKKPRCLSTISIATDAWTFPSECKNEEIQNENENYLELSIEKYETDDINEIPVEYPTENDGIQDSSQGIDEQNSLKPGTASEEIKKNDEGNVDDFTTFDDAWSDEETDQPSEAKRPRRSVVDNAKKAKEDDESQDKSSEKSKDWSSESSDSDWKSSAPPLPAKRKHKKTKPPPPRFRIEIQNYDVDSMITREPVAEAEAPSWLERERRSAYFRLSKRRKCQKCVAEIPDNEDHDSIYHSPSNPLVCDICKYTCSSEAVLSSHVAAHRSVLACALCAYRCVREPHMRSHVHWHRRQVRCQDCRGTFRSIEEFQKHYEKLHGLAICDHCGKHFPHKLLLEHHIQRKHLPQVCTICNATFKSYDGLKSHRDLKHYVERTEAAYCVQCDIQFDNVNLLKRHVYTSRKHARESTRAPPKPAKQNKEKEVFKCPDCPNLYRSARTMRLHHSFVHENIKQFYCDQCDKAYTSKSGLESHIKLAHMGYVEPKNKFCNFCGRGFKSTGTLKNHIRTHTGERPFSCPKCDAKFAQKTAMLYHVKHIHEKIPRKPVATSSENTLNLHHIPLHETTPRKVVATSSENPTDLNDIPLYEKIPMKAVATSSENVFSLDDIPF